METDVDTGGTTTEAGAGGDAGSEPAATPIQPPTRASLEAKVAESLKSFRGTFESETPDEPASEPKTVSEISDGPATNDEEHGEDSESTKVAAEVEEHADSEDTGDQPPKPEPKAKTPTIPDAYRRTLKAYDWTDDEINDAVAQNPAGFLVTAQKLHANRNAELAKWAEMGRSSRSETEVSGENAKTATEASGAKHIDTKTGTFRPLNVDALVAKHGNEDLVRELADPINAVIAEMNRVLPQVMTGAHAIQKAREQTLAAQIDQFFGGPELKPYVEAYGADTAAMTPENQKARMKVLEMADALMAGAKIQGRVLNLSEALTLAHDCTSGEFRTAAVRKDIKGKVTTRNAGLSLRPSQAGPKAATGVPKNRTDLEKRTANRLASVFGGN